MPNYDGQTPLIIAGPCAAESRQQIISTAQRLHSIEGVKIFRAGLWKARTRPCRFEGIGEKGFGWLREVKRDYGLPTATEVLGANHAQLCIKHGIDVLWIGARTSVNPFDVQEIAEALRGTGVPIMIKNPINADPSLWMGAIERFLKAGLDKIAAIHRGFSDLHQSAYRNRPLWNAPLALRREFPGLPILCDPSHIAGRRALIAGLCRKALSLGMDGLMIEVHSEPKAALSDTLQQITPEALHTILDRLAQPTDGTYKDELEGLRWIIDRIDDDIVKSLALRMETVGEIAEIKKSAHIAPLQPQRWKEVVEGILAKAKQLGLSERYVHRLYEHIHEESLKYQRNTLQ